jgi:ATP-dependent helicase HrpB
MDRSLPIYEVEDQIIEGVKNYTRVIIDAPTGSGKSTQIPQILLKNGLNGDGTILILQPRRIAARLLARRVAQEMDTRPGDIVGYQVRFEDVASRNTKIKFITEGILLRNLITNNTLKGVSILIFDEFHERHLYTDVSLAMALHLQKTVRPDLKIIVMSATLQIDELENYLSPCCVVKSEGKTYPVTIDFYNARGLVPMLPLWTDVVKTFKYYKNNYPEKGDVLIFLPGAYDIRKTIEKFQEEQVAEDYLIFPLYGELPLEAQEAAIKRYNKKKIVVATNIAETSVTIDGITTVIDSGLAKIPITDPLTGVSSLSIIDISKASADQRAGRAGRTAPGLCIRMWTKHQHEDRPDFEPPEIVRLELSEIVLLLKAAGINDLSVLSWFDEPPEESLFAAERLLRELGAIDEKGRITETGMKMAIFPLHPRYSRMLLESQKYNCVYYAALIAAIVQNNRLVGSLYLEEQAINCKRLLLGHEDSDFFMLMKAFNYAVENNFDFVKCLWAGIQAEVAYSIYSAHQQFLNIAESVGLSIAKSEFNKQAIRKCILVGFSDLVGKRVNISNDLAEVVHGRIGNIDSETVVKKPDLFVTSKIFKSEEKEELTFYQITRIEEEWLKELFPNDIKKSSPRRYYDPQTRSVMEEENILYRDLVLKKSLRVAAPSEETAKILAEKVRSGELILKDWDTSVDRWILRVNFLNKHCPELGIPHIGDEEKLAILQQICYGASTYKEIKDTPVKKTVYSFLNENQREIVDKFAPERLKLSNGKTPKVVYVENGSPYIAMRIQELYDVTSIPPIANGKVEVLVHILAPNMQPVQITNNLKRFWQEQYPDIKKQYLRLYPKHEWR